MADAPTKPGPPAPRPRLAIDDTLRLRPATPAEGTPVNLDGAPPAAESGATRSLPASERYQLGAELGRGGMGRVVEAVDLQLGRTVALKEVLATASANVVRRFAREVQLTARLEHPSIVPLYDAGTTADGRPFYVMRRVSGRPLDQLMAQAPSLSERLTLLPAVLAAIDAVAHAHRRGVIHRDLKPGNILVGELGETIVIDWGLAKVIDEDDDPRGGAPADASGGLRTQLGAVFGTPGFMAPEQARGEPLDPRGDVYALGATLYQLLAGAPPHAGTSATEVIARTGSRQVAPVEAVAPGAPPELVAIVGKALAFEPAGRYADAGALGEDVRRFLTGQLVAAHRYTSRQRIARFARRHRAPLAVAALAMVSLAVLAWVGVHRIVRERDVATVAREAATRERRAAEQARDELQRRADQLVVLQARGLLDRNPTHAAAVLKELPASSTRLGDARALAQAAAVRGTAWTLRGSDELTVFAELSADGAFLVQTVRDGTVRVIDAVHRREVLARVYAPDVRALWVGKQVLVIRPSAPPELLDPFAGSAGRSRPLALPPMSWAVASEAGDLVVFLDAERAPHLYDVASKIARPLWPGHAVREVGISADGRWIAMCDAAGLVVVDPGGRELLARAGRVDRLELSRFDELAVLSNGKISSAKVAPGARWVELDLAPQAPGIVIDLVYRARELTLFLSTGKVLAWSGARVWERFRIDGLNHGLVAADRDLVIVPGNDGKLRFVNEVISGALQLPTPLTTMKVLGRPGAPRVVAIGRGLIVGFELADVIPDALELPVGISGAFIDDETMLVGRQLGGGWRWLDLRTRRTTPVAFDPVGVTTILGVDPASGRVLLAEAMQDAGLVLLTKRGGAVRRLGRGKLVWGRLLPDDTVLFGVGDARVLAAVGDAPPREVAKLDGISEHAVGLGGRRFAALSRSGELVRGDLDTGALERARVEPGATSALAADRAGRVLVGEDGRLLAWTKRGVEELARMPQRIVAIVPIEDAALVELADRSMVRTALRAGAAIQQVIPASSWRPVVSGDGHVVLGASVNGQITVVEAATRASWELPAYHPLPEVMAVAPSGRRFVEGSFGRVAVWSLPLAPTELGAWLDARTNALTDADHGLIWPWQVASTPL